MRRTPSISTEATLRRRGAGALVLALLALTACGAGRTGPSDGSPVGPPAARDVRALLERSAAAWNRGDLEAFIADYAEDASFVTSSGLVHGSDEIRAIYQRAYWNAGQPRDGLRYRDLDIRRTGPASAVAFGRFVLYDRESDDVTATGTFSLTLREAADGWEIVHDHSSSDG